MPVRKRARLEPSDATHVFVAGRDTLPRVKRHLQILALTGVLASSLCQCQRDGGHGGSRKAEIAPSSDAAPSRTATSRDSFLTANYYESKLDAVSKGGLLVLVGNIGPKKPVRLLVSSTHVVPGITSRASKHLSLNTALDKNGTQWVRGRFTYPPEGYVFLGVDELGDVLGVLDGDPVEDLADGVLPLLPLTTLGIVIDFVQRKLYTQRKQSELLSPRLKLQLESSGLVPVRVQQSGPSDSKPGIPYVEGQLAGKPARFAINTLQESCSVKASPERSQDVQLGKGHPFEGISCKVEDRFSWEPKFGVRMDGAIGATNLKSRGAIWDVSADTLYVNAPGIAL